MANGTKTFDDVVSKVEDLMADSNFSSNRTNEILRAIQGATERVNIGDIGEDKGMDSQVGYDFQKEVADINFDQDEIDYTLISTLGLKFPTDLRIKTDLNIEFRYQRPDYFFRKAGVLASQENMFTITYEGGTQILKINYETTDTLELEYIADFMWLDDDASTRKENTDGDSSDKLLMPDRFWLCIPYLAAADLAQQYFNDKSTQPQRLEATGVRWLKRMVSSIGIINNRPKEEAKIRSEWPGTLSKINRL